VVLAKALLTGNQGVSVVRILHFTFIQVRVTPRRRDVGQESGTFLRGVRELPDCLDFLLAGFLFGDHVVETKHHQRVCVGEALVRRAAVAGQPGRSAW